MIREMRKEDWERVSAIYTQGIESGGSTFNTECPGFAEWDASHCRECRFVFEEENTVAGWVAVSPTSSRECYRGVVEVSLYVDRNFRGRGIGTELMKKVIEEAPKVGFWSLYGAILSANKASIAMTKKCGFREIGYRERIAKDRFGQWQNTTMMELRL